jgi:hypothetical protein
MSCCRDSYITAVLAQWAHKFLLLERKTEHVSLVTQFQSKCFTVPPNWIVTNKATPWSRALHEKLTVVHLVKNFSHLLWNLKIQYCIHESLPPVHIVSHMNQVHTLLPSFIRICFNIILPPTPQSSKWSLSIGFSKQNFECISRLPCIPRVLPISSSLIWS